MATKRKRMRLVHYLVKAASDATTHLIFSSCKNVSFFLAHALEPLKIKINETFRCAQRWQRNKQSTFPSSSPPSTIFPTPSRKNIKILSKLKRLLIFQLIWMRDILIMQMKFAFFLLSRFLFSFVFHFFAMPSVQRQREKENHSVFAQLTNDKISLIFATHKIEHFLFYLFIKLFVLEEIVKIRKRSDTKQQRNAVVGVVNRFMFGHVIR